MGGYQGLAGSLQSAHTHTDAVDVQAGSEHGSSLLQVLHMYCQEHLKCAPSVSQCLCTLAHHDMWVCRQAPGLAVPFTAPAHVLPASS